MDILNTLEKHQDNLKKLNTAIEVIKHDSEYFRKEVDTCTRDKMDKVVFDQFVMHTNKLMKNLNEELIKQRKETEDTENYLVKYHPFKTLNYIHDALRAVLPGKPFFKLLNNLTHIY
jgi:predicted RNase H-like nuclease (RuvC/YqgF family)